MPTPEVVYLNDLGFHKSLVALRKRGGTHQRAFNEACRVIESLRLGMDESNKITGKGESRIRSCVKYELGKGAHRLVTVHSDGCIYLLFAGDHDDTDRWLTRNRGTTITCNPKTKRVRVTIVTRDETPRPIPPPDPEKTPVADTPYVDRLEGGLDLSTYIPRRSLARAISQVNDDTSDDDLLDLIDEVQEIDSDVAKMLLDVMSLVKEGRLGAAVARIQAHHSEAAAVQDVPEVEREAIHDDINAEDLVVLTGLNASDFDRLLNPDRFHEWMLFPHPDQKRIAREEFEKPVILTGVSGSGKTCVLLHRSRYLAAKYPGERIGILTLNRSLARLLKNLLTELCDAAELESIEVFAFYDYFKLLLEELGPEKELANIAALAEKHEESEHILRAIQQVDPDTYVREFDPLSGETLNETWKVFAENPRVRTQLTYILHDHVEERRGSTVDPEEYLREEFSLIRSSSPSPQREEEYLKLERVGRSIPLAGRLRKVVLDLLLHLEEEMLVGGILDELSLTQAVMPHAQELPTLPAEKRFRCLLIDEYQDFSTLDLTLLRRVVPIAKPDSLFLCGDSVQKVLVKTLGLNRAGLGRGDVARRRIHKNYRNSKNILQAASTLAAKYGEEARLQHEEIEVLDPELAIRETSWPQIIETRPEDEIQRAWESASAVIESGGSVPWSICLVSACNTGPYSVKDILAQRPEGFPVEVSPLTGDYTRERDTMTVSAMSDVKGFEFSMVIIVGCGASTLPHPGRPWGERWRDALRLYVAITRARDNVELYYSGEPSRFLTDMNEFVEWQTLGQTAPTLET